MNPSQYNEGIKEFCIYPDFGTASDLELSYLSLGLASEAGEVAGLMKKVLRDETDIDTSKWVAEIGDCIWYITRLLDTMGYTLEDAMEYNYNKLKDRKDRNVLKGSGDNR